jgi:hypothetical protein
MTAAILILLLLVSHIEEHHHEETHRQLQEIQKTLFLDRVEDSQEKHPRQSNAGRD